MSKIHIIDVDLGDSIDNIIASSIDTLSAETISNIEQASDLKKTVDAARGKKNKVTPEDLATQNAIDLLTQTDGTELRVITSEELLMAVHPVIDNMTSLVLRLKTALRKNGKYRLEKTAKDKKAAYKLVLFNTDL